MSVVLEDYKEVVVVTVVLKIPSSGYMLGVPERTSTFPPDRLALSPGGSEAIAGSCVGEGSIKT